MRHLLLGILTLLLILLVRTVANAQEAFDVPPPELRSANDGAFGLPPPRPCRPTVACTAEFLPRGYYEIEAGYAARRDGRATSQGGALLLKYSLTDRVQLQVGSNNVVTLGENGARGTDGALLGAKFLLTQQSLTRPAVALALQLTLPTLTVSDAQQRTYDLAAWLHVSKRFGAVETNVGAGVNAFALGREMVALGLVAASASWKLGRGFALVNEVYSHVGQTRRYPLDAGWLTAVSYTLGDSLTFDAGGDIGFHPQHRAYTVFAGLTWIPYRGGRSVARASATSLPAHLAMAAAD